MKAPIDNFRLEYFPKGSVTQWFGENPDIYRMWGLAYHNGIDVVAYKGAPIYAVESGEVLDVKEDPNGYGRHVRVLCDDREWTYGHLDTINVSVGDLVREGQCIATMGNSGFVQSGKNSFWGDHQATGNDGTHLHLGLRQVKLDPKGFKYQPNSKRISILNYGNGVKGAIDPRPFLSIPLLTRLVELLKLIVKK